MKQPSLFETLGVSPTVTAAETPRSRNRRGCRLEVYDFFAGAGGFSEGAQQAGCRVVYACDNSEEALKTHAANHPKTRHHLAELPLPRSAWPFPTDGRAFHVHFSPPCQKFSQANKHNRVEGDRAHAQDLVTWSLETAIASGASSWSLEEVASEKVVKLVQAVRRKHPTRVAFAKFDLVELGVPQTRQRLLAGSPQLIARLMRLRSQSNTRTVRDVLAEPRGTHIKNSKSWSSFKRAVRSGDKPIKYKKAELGENCRSIDMPAPTVCGSHAHSWVTTVKGESGQHCVLSPSELAVLQTFPADYKLPERKTDAYLQVGNAVPPLVARLLLAEEARRVANL